MKTWFLVILIMVVFCFSGCGSGLNNTPSPTPVSEKPMYTSTALPINHGTYGNTNIPTIISDETGKQLFDGDYGMYDWMCKAPVQSDSDYTTRFDQQKGYGIPWVSWRGGYQEILTIDSKQPFDFNQIGLHCYYRLPDIFLPTQIDLEFSNDGVNFNNHISKTFDSAGLASDQTYWENFSFTTATARYCKIYVNAPLFLFIDEISINGLDGSKF